MNKLLYSLVFATLISIGCTTREQPSHSERIATKRALTALQIEKKIIQIVGLTKNWEEAEYREYKQQDIDGDGIDDTILLTTFEYGNSSRQILFVCLSSSLAQVMSISVGGGKGDRLAEKFDIKDRMIIIRGNKYAISDASCCPSIPYESKLAITNGQLVEVK